jgi:hypothetical protein
MAGIAPAIRFIDLYEMWRGIYLKTAAKIAQKISTVKFARSNVIIKLGEGLQSS